MEIPEIVNITVQTPYPGTETWLTESRRLTTLDYRLFDVQHAVLPTRLPLHRFYEELVKTQAVLARKHLGVAALTKTIEISDERAQLPQISVSESGYLQLPHQNKYGKEYPPDAEPGSYPGKKP